MHTGNVRDRRGRGTSGDKVSVGEVGMSISTACKIPRYERAKNAYIVPILTAKDLGIVVVACIYSIKCVHLTVSGSHCQSERAVSTIRLLL